MSELFYPTIDLFIYDLRNPLNADVAKLADNLQAFQARLPPNTKLQDVETENAYRELITPPRLKLDSTNINLEGYFYPVRLKDTFGLQIDCSVKNQTEPQPLNSISLIEKEIEPYSQFKASTIGKTWLVSGWLDEHTQDSETIARECYQKLFKQDKWKEELYGKGTLCKGDVFEIWQSQSYPHQHLIIILFPNQAMAEKAAELYTDWMGLLCYRHKITWAYHQSRLIKEALVNHYQKVESSAKIIKKSQGAKVNLTNLQELFNDIQDILNKYTIDLLNLSFQKQTIDINLVNYQRRLEFIKQNAKPESDLTFLEQFSNLAEIKYLSQIDKDAENMQLGLKLLETNINALRSQIELEKSERDRNFQNLVTIVGAGTAIAALVDYKGEKCQKIFNVPPNQKDSHFCNDFWQGSIGVPLLSIILLGLTALLLKWLFLKINALLFQRK